MSKYGWFKPLKAAPRRRRVLAFDCEGNGEIDGFVCGSVVGDGVREFYTDRREMYRALLGHGDEGFVLVSHNLEYDLPVLQGEAFPQGDFLFLRSGILWARVPYGGRKVLFWDSLNLFPHHSVASLGELVGISKLELFQDTLTRLRVGPPWGSFSHFEQELIREYNLRDSEIVYRAVELMQEMCLELGGNLKPTIAGVSMDVYRRKHHKWPWPVVGPVVNKWARPAFYGGRVENFGFGIFEGANLYDVTSMYPYVMGRARFPHPNHLELMVNPAIHHRWLDWEGVCQAVVDAPEEYIPLLPYRYDKKLFFPVGRMRGTWSILELRRALEAGCQLIELEWALGGSVLFNPFAEFVERLYELREFHLVESMGKANLLKLILNSLYGRFGLKAEGGLQRLVNVELIEDWEKIQGYVTGEINGQLFARGPVEAGRQPDYVNLLFAAQIAAAARLELYDKLQPLGESAIYCDTDSVLTTASLPTRDGLGGWRLEAENVQADLVSPKEYALHSAYLGDVYHVKGVPVSLAKQYFETSVARFYRASGVLEALSRGERPAVWVETIRSRGDAFPKRQPLEMLGEPGNGRCLSQPYLASQLEEATQGVGFRAYFETLTQDRVQPLAARPVQGRLV